MDREKLIQAGVNYDEGVERFANKPELYEKYLKKLFAGTTMSVLLQQLEDGDEDGAFRTAHDLKGNTGNLSLTALYRAVCELVEILRPKTAGREAYMPAAQKVKRLYDQAEKAVLEADHD